MEPAREPQRLQHRYALPARGEVRRLQRGRWQLIVEHGRRGLAVLAHDGRRSQRWWVGAPPEGELEIGVWTPRFPVRVTLTDLVTLASGGRLRGYVDVPLPYRVGVRLPNGEIEPLAELVPQSLQTSWLGQQVGYVHEVRARFALDMGGLGGDGDVVIPVSLRNATAGAITPEAVTLHLEHRELRELRARIVAAPRTLTFRGDELPRETVRPFLGAPR